MKKSLTSRIYLKRQLYSLRTKEDTKVPDHLNTFNTLIVQLTSMEVKFEDEDKAITLLCPLRESWDKLVTSISSTSGASEGSWAAIWWTDRGTSGPAFQMMSGILRRRAHFSRKGFTTENAILRAEPWSTSPFFIAWVFMSLACGGPHLFKAWISIPFIYLTRRAWNVNQEGCQIYNIWW
jgi:hypothetical protein